MGDESTPRYSYAPLAIMLALTFALYAFSQGTGTQTNALFMPACIQGACGGSTTTAHTTTLSTTATTTASTTVSATTTAPPMCTVYAYAEPSQGGTVTASSSAPCGSAITLSEAPSSGYAFTGWTCSTTPSNGQCYSGSASSFTVTTSSQYPTIYEYADFEAASSSGAPKITIVPNKTYAGQPVLITGVCRGTDSCSIEQPYGTVLARGNGTVTYNTSAPLGPTSASYSVYDAATGNTTYALLTVLSTPHPNITITPSTIGPGQLVTITAKCYDGDTCSVFTFSPVGVNLATGKGSATYTTTNLTTPGHYLFYANDSTGQVMWSAVLNVTNTPVTCTVNAYANPASGGAATASPQVAPCGIPVTISAVPATGYMFEGWVCQPVTSSSTPPPCYTGPASTITFTTSPSDTFVTEIANFAPGTTSTTTTVATSTVSTVPNIPLCFNLHLSTSGLRSTSSVTCDSGSQLKYPVYINTGNAGWARVVVTSQGGAVLYSEASTAVCGGIQGTLKVPLKTQITVSLSSGAGGGWCGGNAYTDLLPPAGKTTTTSVTTTSTVATTIPENTTCQSKWSTVYVNQSASCGSFTVALEALGQPNAQGQSPGVFNIYFNGALTNTTVVQEDTSETFNVGGLKLYMFVNSTFAGLYAYQKYANIYLSGTVPPQPSDNLTITTLPQNASIPMIINMQALASGGTPPYVYSYQLTPYNMSGGWITVYSSPRTTSNEWTDSFYNTSVASPALLPGRSYYGRVAVTDSLGGFAAAVYGAFTLPYSTATSTTITTTVATTTVPSNSVCTVLAVVNPLDDGFVSPSSASVTCGTLVTLTALPAPSTGYVFLGWSCLPSSSSSNAGCYTGTNPTITIATTAADPTVTEVATFVELPTNITAPSVPATIVQNASYSIGAIVFQTPQFQSYLSFYYCGFNPAGTCSWNYLNYGAVYPVAINQYDEGFGSYGCEPYKNGTLSSGCLPAGNYAFKACLSNTSTASIGATFLCSPSTIVTVQPPTSSYQACNNFKVTDDGATGSAGATSSGTCVNSNSGYAFFAVTAGTGNTGLVNVTASYSTNSLTLFHGYLNTTTCTGIVRDPQLGNAAGFSIPPSASIRLSVASGPVTHAANCTEPGTGVPYANLTNT